MHANVSDSLNGLASLEESAVTGLVSENNSNKNGPQGKSKFYNWNRILIPIQHAISHCKKKRIKRNWKKRISSPKWESILKNQRQNRKVEISNTV
jgi:hypothetical protein